MLTLLNSFDTHLDFFCFESSFLNHSCNASDRAAAYATTVYANAMAAILIRWVKTGMQETPVELARIFHEIMTLNGDGAKTPGGSS